MFVCLCNAVTDRQIRDAARQGAYTLEEVRRMTSCGDCCGHCTDLAEEILAGETLPLFKDNSGYFSEPAGA